MPLARPWDRAGGSGQNAVAGELREEHVTAVFREFLGREASAQDIQTWMQAGSVGTLLDGVLGSDEYRARHVEPETVDDDGPFLNFWSEELARFCRPVGSLSADGVAVVGAQGHLFLCGGSNDNLAMYRGQVAMAPDWLTRWQQLLSSRREHATAHGRTLSCLVVPDKLAVYEDLYPDDLGSGGPRPVMRLREAVSSVLYPCAELRDARSEGDSYMVTDTHLTCRGNRLLAEVTVASLGAQASLLDAVSREENEVLMSGDLGQHFSPPILEVGGLPVTQSGATIVSDNWAQVRAAGGHIGTVRVFRNDEAVDHRTVVVFGDSYGFGDAAYPGVSWFLAQVFREVHFVWVPFGWDDAYLDSVGAELVVCQTAERFIPRVPRSHVDVRALEADVSRTERPLGLERIFDDVTAVDAARSPAG